MKCLPLFIIVLFFIGCETTKETSRSIYYTGWDFREGTKNSFFITPEHPTGDYESIGILTLKIHPQVIKTDSMKPDLRYWTKLSKSNFEDNEKWYYEDMPTDTIIHLLYQEMSQLGANALTNFLAEEKYERNGKFLVPYWEISGFAIKRK
jgi:hypothetical protein